MVTNSAGALLLALSWGACRHAPPVWSGSVEALHAEARYVIEAEDAAFSPDGKLLVAIGDAGIRLHDAETGSVVQVLSEQPCGGGCLIALSPGGDQLMASVSGGVAIWSTRDWAPGPLLVHDAGVACMAAVSSDRLATASFDGSVFLWALPQGEPRVLTVASDAFPQAPGCLAASPGGKRLVFATGTEGPLLSIDPDTGEVETGSATPGEEGRWDAVAFAEDGRLFASGSPGLIRIFGEDLSPQRALSSDHHGDVVGLAVSPGGALLASVDWDGPARVRRIEDDVELLALDHPGQPEAVGRVDRIRFDPSGLRIATGGSDGRVTVWAVAPAR